MKTDQTIVDVQPQQFYHGGLLGRRVNDLILSPVITKVRPDWHRNGLMLGAGPMLGAGAMHRVYVSTTYLKSVCYAVGRPLKLGRDEVGKVYRVQPNGPLSVDLTDDTTPPDAYYCESARVLEVISPSVEDVMLVPGTVLADFLENPAWTTSGWGEFYLLSLLVRYAIHANEPPAKALSLFNAARNERNKTQ